MTGRRGGRVAGLSMLSMATIKRVRMRRKGGFMKVVRGDVGGDGGTNGGVTGLSPRYNWLYSGRRL